MTVQQSLNPERGNLARQRILIADDQTFIRSTLMRLLGSCGYKEVHQASDGWAALTILREQGINCLLTDFKMQGMSGLHLLKRIRIGEAGIRRHMPVILVTGHADQALVSLAQALDVSAILVKPFTASTLSAHLQRALSVVPPLKDPQVYASVQLPLEEEEQTGSGHLPAWTVIPQKSLPFLTAADLAEKASAAKAARPHGIENPMGAEAEGFYQDKRSEKTRIPKLAAVEKLRPGHVLAEDIINNSGKLMLKKGAALTQPLVEKLNKMRESQEIPDYVSIYI